MVEARTAATTQRERDDISKEMEKHHALCGYERKVSRDRQVQATLHPDKFLYLEMDSMDQNKTSIPHYRTVSKEFDDKAAVSTVVTNVRVPGLCCLNYVYTNNFPHDSNTTVTVLHL